MKYLIKSNLFVLAIVFIPAVLFITFLGEEYFSLNTTLLITITLLEAFIVKVSYDYLNYDHDYKYHVHRLPKVIFYIIPILLNFLSIGTIIMMSFGPLKWILLVSLAISNAFHIVIKKNMLLLPILALTLFFNLAYTYLGVMFFVWLGCYVLASFGLAWWLKYRSVKVYTYDNY